MGTVVQQCAHLTPWPLFRQVYWRESCPFCVLSRLFSSSPADGAPSPAAKRGADQTLFLRRIALRPPAAYFGESHFGPTVPDPTFFERLGATFFNPPQAWWIVEGPTVAPRVDGDTEPLTYNEVETVAYSKDGSEGLS
jgi:hypothetical protein